MQRSGGESSEAKSLPLAGWRVFSRCFGEHPFPFPSVGALSYVLSEESERVSELKSRSGSSKLPYGTLALGAEGIKDAIRGFDDAYALFAASSRPAGGAHTRFHPVDVNRTLKTRDCHPTWSTQTRKRAKRISHPRCLRAQQRTPNQMANFPRTASRQR